MSVINVIEFPDVETAKRILPLIRKDGGVYGSIDFEKIILSPKNLIDIKEQDMILAINVYFSAINPNNEDMGEEKFEKEEYEKIKCEMQKKRGSIPVVDNLPYAIIEEISRNFFEEYGKKIPEEYGDNIFLLGQTIVENLQNYDVLTKPQWMSKYWGSSCNAYDEPEQNEDTTMISFSANYPPHEILKEISMLCMDKEVKLFFASGDFASFIGARIYKSGTIIHGESYTEESKNAKILAKKVKDKWITTHI